MFNWKVFSSSHWLEVFPRLLHCFIAMKTKSGVWKVSFSSLIRVKFYSHCVSNPQLTVVQFKTGTLDRISKLSSDLAILMSSLGLGSLLVVGSVFNLRLGLPCFRFSRLLSLVPCWAVWVFVVINKNTKWFVTSLFEIKTITYFI